jgi:2-oxoisovalerate dehydrogenase E1 component subunit alpha
MTKNWHPDEHLPVIARFEVRHRAYLAPDGSTNRQLPAFASDTNLLVRLYRAMVLVRAFDVKAVALQRTGRLGTYAASLGRRSLVTTSSAPICAFGKYLLTIAMLCTRAWASA